MTFKVIKTSTLYDNILSLEFKSTNKNNPLSIKMIDELIDILSRKNFLKNYQAIAFSGYKDAPFSAGADLKDINSLKKRNNINIYHKKLSILLNKLRELKVVKVSLINNFCIGAGFIFAMNTDIRIANSDCFFSIPATRLNIKLPKSQIIILKRKFPKNQLLKEAILTGRKFTAYEAINFNLINIVYGNKSFRKNYLSFLSTLSKIEKKIQQYYLKNL